MNCTGITIGSDYDCENPIQPGLKNTIYIGNLADLDSVVESAGVISDFTMKPGTFLYSFEGTKNSVSAEQAKAALGYTHMVDFSVFDLSSNQKRNLDRMAHVPVFAIVEQMNASGNGNNYFEMYGAKAGLYLEALSRIAADTETQGAFKLVLKTLEQ